MMIDIKSLRSAAPILIGAAVMLSLSMGMLGSYDLAWKLIAGMGLTAGLVQLLFAVGRPLPPRLATSDRQNGRMTHGEQ